MRQLKHLILAATGALFLMSAAQAANIDFSTASVGATDPTIGDVKFWAGDPSVPNDTYVDDYLTPGNNYLLSGYADGYGMSPSSGYDAFVGVSRVSSAKFGAVSFDIAAIFGIPSGTTLRLQGLSNGGEVFLSVSDADYHSLSFDFTSFGGADQLRISADLNGNGISDTSFRIDNFVYTDFVPACTGPNCNVLPEPGSLLLVGLGLAGVALARRRKSV